MQGMRIRTPNDIQNLPGYVSKIDPKLIPLSHIVIHYDIRPFDIQCGLCGRAHMDGRIIALADVSKSITNIGHICGKKYFGDMYVDALRRYNDAITRPQLLQKVSEGIRKVDSLQLQLQSIRLHGVSLLRQSVQFHALSPEIFDLLKRRAINNQADIYESVERTKEEIEDLLAANPFQSRDQLLTKEVYRGTVAGHKFLSIDWSVERGIQRLFCEVSELLDFNFHPGQLATHKLVKWANWLDDLDEQIKSVKSAVLEGERFFSQTNLQLFALLPALPAAREKIRNFHLSELDDSYSVRSTPYKTLPAQKVRPLGRIRAERPKSQLTLKQLRRLLGNKKVR
ncbi:MAG: hypothetical protein JWQ21_2970 [Herminiimonas sp.]|nr:hypothetical protein [Herminiimonas sp.]